MVAILLVRRASGWLAVIGASGSLTASTLALARVSRGARYEFVLPGGIPSLPLRLLLDPLAALLSVTVSGVVLLVLVYALGYMAEEREHPRFFAEMSFFAASMQALVLAGDWILFLAAWELIGLSSYLLISFNYERPETPPAAARAFLTTRSADLGLYLAVFILITQAGTNVMGSTVGVRGTAGLLAGMLLLVAAMGKAAQVPFQGWLQDAMLAPTPVSALLHSATLVAAGAILVARAFPLFTPGVLLTIALVGGVTTVVSGLMAIAQRDLKRLLAASTSSQLGFMFLAAGAGSVAASVAHLVTHAAMKSALFQGAGVYQHAYGSTSLDALRGAGRSRRVTFGLFTVAALALAGVPPLAGFWSKDAIEASAFETGPKLVLGSLTMLGTLLTATYVGRFLRLLWHGPRADREVPGSAWMVVALSLLAVLAAVLGAAVEPIGKLLGQSLPSEVLSMAAGLTATFVGLGLGWLLPLGSAFGRARPWAEVGFRVGGGFAGLVVRPALLLSGSLDTLDNRITQGVLGVGRAGLVTSRRLHWLDEGVVATALGTGRGGLVASQLLRWLDERGVEGLLNELVQAVRGLGQRGRQLQSGLVFRELAIAGGGIAFIIVFLLVAR